MADYVDLDQKVDAQYYDEMTEEWDLKTTTIGHILDSVCDDYKIAVDAVEVVRCKDCRHRPIYAPKNFLGPILAPENGDGEWDSKCPFICSDPYYSAMPPDDHYCAYGERTENGSNEPDEYPVCFNMI